MRRSAALALSLSLALLPPAASAVAEEFTPEQEEAIQALVRDYLLEHPEIILEAVQKLEAKQAEAANSSRAGAIEEQ